MDTGSYSLFKGIIASGKIVNCTGLACLSCYMAFLTMCANINDVMSYMKYFVITTTVVIHGIFTANMDYLKTCSHQCHYVTVTCVQREGKNTIR